MHGEDTALGLIDNIYAAAVDSTQWPALLAKLADELHATTTSLIFCDLDAMKGGTHAAVRCDPDALRNYAKHYIHIDCFGQKRKHLIQTGQVLPGPMLCPEDEMVKTEYYNDFLRSIDLHHQCCTVIRAQWPSVSVVASMRPKRAGQYNDVELKLLHVLTPHFQRALMIHEKLTEAESRSVGFANALDRFPTGVLLVGQDGRILALNRNAEQIVSQRDGLRIESKFLRAMRNSESALLTRMIQDATQSSLKSRTGGVVKVSRISLKRPYQVLVFPIAMTGLYWGLEWKQVAAAVFITDHDSVISPHPGMLITLFEFTPAEARLASLLMEGLSMEECRDRLLITENTARTHMKRIFSKTATRRQSELVRLLLKSPAGLSATDVKP